MLYALVEGEKLQASPKITGLCPYCSCEMIAKCGNVKSWHWSHKRNALCDTWYKPETEWHRNWKIIFGKDHSEIIIIENNIKHIADIKTIYNRVIELQNSLISYETIRSREEFYSSGMIWIINGTPFFHDFYIKPLQGLRYDPKTPEFEKMAQIHGFTPVYKPNNGEKDEQFEWLRPRTVWAGAEAQVYIDFGKDYLFCIKEGLGCSKGKGVRISKKQFIVDNGGDISLISCIIN